MVGRQLSVVSFLSRMFKTFKVPLKVPMRDGGNVSLNSMACKRRLWLREAEAEKSARRKRRAEKAIFKFNILNSYK